TIMISCESRERGLSHLCHSRDSQAGFLLDHPNLAGGQDRWTIQWRLLRCVEETRAGVESVPIPQRPLPLLVRKRPRKIDLGIDVDFALQHIQIYAAVETLEEKRAAALKQDGDFASQVEVAVDQRHARADTRAGDQDIDAGLGVDSGVGGG